MSGRWSSWSLQSGQSGCGGSGSAGQHGTSNYDAWATWTCGHCQTVNWANYGSQKKRCSTCGIKKSYRDAALGGHAHGPPQSQQNAVRSQIQSVQAQLANPVLRIPAVACAPPPLDAALRAASDASPAGPVDRKAILADIKELEGLAAGIQNPALMHIKDELNERISQKKNLLHKTRPVGVQLDGARDLVSRSQARHKDAHDILAQAQKAAEAADVELANATAALAAVEADLSQADPGSAQPNCIEDMASSLTRVITEMRGGTSVPQHLLSETEQHMHNLMRGVRAISAATLAAALAASGPPLEGPTAVAGHAAPAHRESPEHKKIRLVGKGPCIQATDPYAVVGAEPGNGAIGSSPALMMDDSVAVETGALLAGSHPPCL